VPTHISDKDYNRPLTRISDKEGRSYTYREAADLLGVNKEYFLKRLKNWRLRGYDHLTIEFLRAHRVGRLPTHEKLAALALLPAAA
jgi:hypothetical protein